MELRRRFRGQPASTRDGRPRRTVAELLDAAAETRRERERRAQAAQAAQEGRRARERAVAREKRLDALARDPETAWARVSALIATRKPADYDAAVDLLKDLQTVAQRADQAGEFTQRYAQLRRQHHRKDSLIARLDRSDLTLTSSC